MPVEYDEGDILPIYVSDIESMQAGVPYNYYDVGACRPPKNLRTQRTKRWGESLAGERWRFSPYNVTLSTKVKNGIDPAEF